ncbi:MAG: hypothetical protein EON93_18260 [Burkholderiales bacterium]|nr:MAG: hypothetical protein EON93_18260 [Burkholderiales bacterium]
MFGLSATRADLPGGGSVLVPEPYNREPSYPTYAGKHGIEKDMRVAYRNWRSTMSGHPECDGMIAIGRTERFDSLKAFMQSARAGLSIHWSDADRIPGQPWDGNEKRYPAEESDGAAGPQIVQLLCVGRVGFLKPYDLPALMYVAGNRNGLHIGVWIADIHGGAKKAERLVSAIAQSFTG